MKQVLKRLEVKVERAYVKSIQATCQHIMFYTHYNGATIGFLDAFWFH